MGCMVKIKKKKFLHFVDIRITLGADLLTYCSADGVKVRRSRWPQASTWPQEPLAHYTAALFVFFYCLVGSNNCKSLF